MNIRNINAMRAAAMAASLFAASTASAQPTQPRHFSAIAASAANNAAQAQVQRSPLKLDEPKIFVQTPINYTSSVVQRLSDGNAAPGKASAAFAEVGGIALKTMCGLASVLALAGLNTLFPGTALAMPLVGVFFQEAASATAESVVGGALKGMVSAFKPKPL